MGLEPVVILGNVGTVGLEGLYAESVGLAGLSSEILCLPAMHPSLEWKALRSVLLPTTFTSNTHISK
jgi:hypothetical protein